MVCRLRKVGRKVVLQSYVTPCTCLKQSDRPTLSYQNNTMGQVISAQPAAAENSHSGSCNTATHVTTTNSENTSCCHINTSEHTWHHRMAPTTQFGLEVNHVRYTVRLPELPKLRKRASKPSRRSAELPKLGKKMKLGQLPRLVRKKRKMEKNNTGTLDSLGVDWRAEFEQKFAELRQKTRERQDETETRGGAGLQERLADLSLELGSGTSGSPVNLSLTSLSR